MLKHLKNKRLKETMQKRRKVNFQKWHGRFEALDKTVNTKNAAITAVGASGISTSYQLIKNTYYYEYGLLESVKEIGMNFKNFFIENWQFGVKGIAAALFLKFSTKRIINTYNKEIVENKSRVLFAIQSAKSISFLGVWTSLLYNVPLLYDLLRSGKHFSGDAREIFLPVLFLMSGIFFKLSHYYAKGLVNLYNKIENWWEKRTEKKDGRFESAVNYYTKRINLLFDKMDEAKTLEELKKARGERSAISKEIGRKYSKKESRKIIFALRPVLKNFFNSYESRRAIMTGRSRRLWI